MPLKVIFSIEEQITLKILVTGSCELIGSEAGSKNYRHANRFLF